MSLLPVDMTILDDLRKNAEEEATTEAPKQQWSEMILGRLYATHPFVHPYKVTLVYKNVKPQDEYATGNLVLTKDGSKWIYVPFIIEAGDLKPLDVMSDGERYHYLTEERLQAALETPMSGFSVPEKVPRMGAMSGDNPEELNTFRDADSFLSKVSKKLSLRHLSARLDELHSRYPRLGGRIAEKRASLEDERSSGAEALAVQVSNEGDCYAVSTLFSDGSIDKESAIHAEVVSLLGYVPLDRLTAPVNARFVDSPELSKIEKLSVDGLTPCMVNTDEGLLPTVVFSDVFTLGGRKLANAIAVGADFDVEGDLYGFQDEEHKVASLLRFSPARGRGVFVFERGITEPVTVKAAYIDDGVEKLSFRDGLGFSGIITYEDVLLPCRIDDHTIAIPKTAQFVCIGEEKRSVAENAREADTTMKSFGSSLKLDGRIKTAEVTEEEMELVLVGLGCPATKADRLIKQAHLVGSTPVFDLGNFDSKNASFIEQPGMVEAIMDFYDCVPDAESALIKEAVGILPVDSVDAILGLQLVTNELLAEARDAVPMLEKTQDKLVELMLLSRLGAVLRGKDGVILRVVKGLDNLMGNLRTLEAGL